MAFFVLIALIALVIIYISVAKKKKRASLVSLVVLGLYYLYVSYTCGPNSADVKVMKPMAEKISAYIIKNGIPESLKDIPDLPYGLVGCSTKKIYNYPEETCRILISNESIKIHFDYGEYTIDKIHYSKVNLNMDSEATETGMHMQLSQKNNNAFVLEDKKFYRGKTSGICNPMRQ